MVLGSTRAQRKRSVEDSSALQTSMERLQVDGSPVANTGEHGQTALVYDPALTAHAPWLSHQKSQPEIPLRVETVMGTLSTLKLANRCVQLQGRNATTEELLSVHHSEHLERLQKLRELDETTTAAHEDLYDSVYFSPHTCESSILAAGCACEAAAGVVSGQFKNAVAVVRPPGHHAFPDRWSGFCYLNNVAIAVRQAQKAGMSRILILDWDIHHGNGTQKIFEDDPSVLFMSLHRYDQGEFYPSKPDADPSVVGNGKAAGYSVNVAWNESGLRDIDYKYAFEQVIMPIACDFNPDIVFVSAGFDGAEGDPLGKCNLKPRAYNYMTRCLQELADGKVVVILEGGYNCQSTAACMSACVEALLGDKKGYSFSRCKRGPTPKTRQSVQLTKQHHRQYWPCLPTDDEPVQCADTVLQASPEACCVSYELATPSKAVSGSESSGEDLSGYSFEKDQAQTPVAALTPVSGPSTGTQSPATGAAVAGVTCSPVSATAAAGDDCSHPAAGTSAEQTVLEISTSLLSRLALDDPGADEGYLVCPKTDCPHVAALSADNALNSINLGTACERCEEKFENWMCLTCQTIACGRAINSHMERHVQRNFDHCLVLSFADLSVWCYQCDSYVERHPNTQSMLEAVHLAKFGVKSF